MYACNSHRAASGMVGIGGLFVMGGGYFPGTAAQVLGALSVLLASVNVAGGFVITKRMLDMFKSNSFLDCPTSPSDPFVQDLQTPQSTLGYMACPQ